MSHRYNEDEYDDGYNDSAFSPPESSPQYSPSVEKYIYKRANFISSLAQVIEDEIDEADEDMQNKINKVRLVLGEKVTIKEIKDGLKLCSLNTEDTINFLIDSFNTREKDKIEFESFVLTDVPKPSYPIISEKKKDVKKENKIEKSPNSPKKLRKEVESLRVKIDNSSSPRNSKHTPSSKSRTTAISLTRAASLLTRKSNLLASSNSNKEELSIVVCGHVDSGKSTIVGHLLLLVGTITQRLINKYEKETNEIGKNSFAYAWVLDEQNEERNRGVTIDVALRYFETPNRYINILDTPGHRDFIPNMISGASQADVALLVVDGSIGNFESGFKEEGQTKEHVILVRSLGVVQFLIAINKMDSVKWDETRYNYIQNQLIEFFRRLGIKEQNVKYIPVSGLSGENITTKSLSCSWYTGSTLFEAFDFFRTSPRFYDYPLRLCIAESYPVSKGVTINGKVESGALITGETLLFLPTNIMATVKSITLHSDYVEIGRAGDNCCVTIVGISEEEGEFIEPGHVVCHPDSPVSVTSLFTAQIMMMSNIKLPLIQGAIVELHILSAHVPATLIKILSSAEKTSNKEKKPKNLQCLSSNMNAIVKFQTEVPICLEKYSNFKALVRDSGYTIAVGLVIEINE